MNNAEKILSALDAKLSKVVELTLYGRAAFALGFESAPKEFARSTDVDAILWIGQAEELAQKTNFWEAVEEVNQEFRDQELFIPHLFEENQVILTPAWKRERVRIHGPWKKLAVSRLGDVDLFLTKLMRDDPQDRADARFLLDQAGWDEDRVANIIRLARVPDLSEIREQFATCAAHFLQREIRERVSLGSAAIKAVAYDRKTKSLDMEFRGGGSYRYFQVPLSVYRSLLKTESAGAFWNEVKDDFNYVKLD